MAKAACTASTKTNIPMIFAYAVIRLNKITARNEKVLTARGTAWKFFHGPKQMLPGPDPGWPRCGYATTHLYTRNPH